MMLTFLVLVAVGACVEARVIFQRERTVCGNTSESRLRLSCPTNQQISVISAMYGRQSTRICPSGANGVTNCRAIRAMEIAKRLCEGKRQCMLIASNRMFGDPCIGVTKYLNVQYKCVELVIPRNEYKCETARDNNLRLECPANHEVFIMNAIYGRMTANVCGNGANGVMNCSAVHAVMKVREMCNGRRRCVVRASNTLFGDPCYGITKYLEVSYKCIRIKQREQQSFHMLPSAKIKAMNSYTGFPQTNGPGRMYLDLNGIITYENIYGRPAAWQWIGWQSKEFAGKFLQIRFGIKFIDQVPAVASNFGMKVYGKVYNSWIRKCRPNTWCFVKMTVKCDLKGDGEHVILIFDSIRQKQKLQIKDFRIDILPSIKKTMKAFDSSALIMGKRGLPQSTSIGKMYPAKIFDTKMRSSEMFTYENTAGKGGPYQWFGWRDQAFANQILQISFWIKFVDQIPRLDNGFGIKVYGVTYNEWVKNCTRDAWCYVRKTVHCRDKGDGNHVILIFDSVNRKQMIHVGRFRVDIMSERKIYVVQASKSRIMNRDNGFPQAIGVGKMYSGGRYADDKFNVDEIITYQNTAGKSGNWQWMGWQNEVFSNKMLRVSFWIKFVANAPSRSGNFGIKLYGKVYNEFVKGCRADTWCYVEERLRCPRAGDRNYVLMIFDSISERRTIRVSQFNVDIL